MRHARTSVIFLGLFLATLLPACTTIPERDPDKSGTIRTIAVLPFINHTNNVVGPENLQRKFSMALYERWYDIVEANDVNAKLKDQMGLTLGSQLDMAKPEMLCKTIGADGLLYRALDDYLTKPFGVYTIKRVRARTKLVDCKTGNTVWKGGAGGKSQEARGGNIGALVGAVGSIGSAVSDVAEGELVPLLGEKIDAPWFSVPPPPQQSSGNVIADIVIGVVQTVLEHAAGVSLSREEDATVMAVLDGYFHEGAITGKNEKGIPSGPVDEF